MKLCGWFLSLFFSITLCYGTPSNWYLYVNQQQNTVIPINQGNLTLGRNLSVGLFPFGIAITPDGTKAYTADFFDNTSTYIDLTLPSPIIVIDVQTNPTGLAITPDGRYVYIVNSNNNFISIIDIQSNKVVKTIPIGNMPLQIAITPDGTTAYVTSNEDGNIYPMNIASGKVGLPIFIGDEPQAIAITPDGKTLYVTQTAGSAVVPIDVATGIPGTPILTGTIPNAVAITSDGQTALVANLIDETITLIDTKTNTAQASIDLGGRPAGVSITPDGKTAYILVNGDSFLILSFDIPSRTFGPSITVFHALLALAITPDQAPTASFVVSDRSEKGDVSFDASASTTPVGTVVKYAWDFGDGHQDTSLFPTIRHNYTLSGKYPVTLTVTNSAGTSTQQTFTGQTVSNNGGPSATITLDIPAINNSLQPPADVRGRQVIERSLLGQNRINVIEWNPPERGVHPVVYKVFMDQGLQCLLKTVPADRHMRFVDNGREQGSQYTYYIVSIDKEGNVSSPVSVTVPC